MTPRPEPIADALVHVQCAHTSLARLAEFGLFGREGPFFALFAPHFPRAVQLVTYGGAADHALAGPLKPAGYPGRFGCVANDAGPAGRPEEPAWFQAGVPERVASALAAAGCRSALVYTDQHPGGEVALQTARLLRRRGVRTGLVARAGYHWSWFEARIHGGDSPQAARAAVLEGELCRGADVVTGSTRRMVDDLSWRHGLPAGRVRLVPNFVVTEGPPPPPAGRDAWTVLGAGRLEPQKRWDLLIRAMPLVAATCPRARLVLHAAGGLEASLRELASAVGAPVEFRPRIPHADLLAALGRCAVYCQPSAYEGHPKTIIEALAMGVPTVVTRGPGVDDEIDHGRTGLVAREDPASIADAIIGLLTDRAAAARMGLAAAADARSRLSLAAVFPLVVAACRDAMALAGAASGGPPAAVRWDQVMLDASPAHAAAEFGASVAAFAARLGADRRSAFLAELAARIEGVTDPCGPRPPAALGSTATA